MSVAADEELRAQLRGLRTSQQVARCRRFRDRPDRSAAARSTHIAMRALARRIEHLNIEITEHDQALKVLLDEAAPQLLAERGVGYITAAELYLAWSHPVAAAAKPPSRASAAGRPLKPPPANARPVIDSTAAATDSPPSPLPRRGHPPALRLGDPGLHRSTRRRRSSRTIRHPLHQALHRPARLAPP